MQILLVRVSVTVKRHHYPNNFYKGKHFIGAGLKFRGSAHYQHGRKHSSMQADTVLEKELRVLYVDLQAAKETVCRTGAQLERRPSKPMSTVT